MAAPSQAGRRSFGFALPLDNGNSWSIAHAKCIVYSMWEAELTSTRCQFGLLRASLVFEYRIFLEAIEPQKSPMVVMYKSGTTQSEPSANLKTLEENSLPNMSHSKASSSQSLAEYPTGSTRAVPYSVDRYIVESSSWTQLSQRTSTPRTTYNDLMQSDLDNLLQQAKQRSRTNPN
ncbi:hypothetical protein BDP55DRAFT_637170 [Colletotrichum godetiae]|uniref:Uncharacterized protein n=1 Tax=Colletotrichum godetiae TaxID=1209918 RepID=A0AAJ0AAW3_9PEZI|nr:uncharacterized protein BDP55DRAFT_637170 [Colletotrichum godetiae]KAK1659144.1 hypothetical protein BDP55DRAFT_637170 [Colletotrichum godetiae]